MGAGHAHSLYRAGSSPIHRLPPQCKLLAVLLFVFVVVATPREQFWAFGAYALLLAGVAGIARVPPGFILRRLVLEAPFLTFAILLPVFSRGERVDVLGLSLSSSGLLAAFNILAKAGLGGTATILLGATTEMRQLLRGLEALHLPRPFVAIATFMLRYLDVIVGEMRRMRLARAARGYDPRSLLQARALAASAGALFIRSYERGERVFLAMQSRGYTGALPLSEAAPPTRHEWASALVLPTSAVVVSAAAWTVQL